MSGRWVVLVAGVAAVAGAWWLATRGRDQRPIYPVPGEGGTHVTAEVLNASGVDGLARAATARLRERGIDVVFYGTAPFDTLRVTRVLARQGDTTAARAVRAALGAGEVANEPDARLLLGVSVYLGRDAAPLLGFRP